MENISFTINNQAFSIRVPDGFEPMTAEELEKLYRDENPDRWGVWNRERHVMLTVLWKRYPVLVGALADVKAIARRNQQLTEKGYAGHDFRPGGFFSMQADGLPLEGYRFSYRIGDVVQNAETVLMKKQKTIYNITCTGREENADENAETFREIIGSLRAG